jgi:hypothetical protein
MRTARIPIYGLTPFLFLTRLPTSNPSSFLPVNRKDVNNYKLTTNEKEENMKTLIAICMMLALMAGSGCQSTKVSGQGGIVPVNEEFNITVPASNTVKQGAETTIAVSLNRGAYFKRDVQLDIQAEGIRVTPSNVLIKASDKPDVKLHIAADRDAALGEYPVSVKGTPTIGEPTSIKFTVKVVAQ